MNTAHLSLMTLSTCKCKGLICYVRILFCLVSMLMLNRPVYADSKTGIERDLHKIYLESNIGAITYAMVENNRIVSSGGFGQKGVNDKTRVNEHSLVRVGSLTKLISAIAFMRRVDNGALQLDADVKKTLPDLPLINPFKNTPITFGMMLEHSAGLTDLSRKEFDYLVPLSIDQAFQVSPSQRQVLWQPGWHTSYSNVGTGYVSAAIEKTASVSFDDWVKKDVLAPLNMHNSTLSWSKEIETRRVRGYDSDLKTEIPYWHTLFTAFGGLNTTVHEMANVILMLLNDGQYNGDPFLSERAVKRIETPNTTLAAKVGLKVGYGLGLRTELINGYMVYTHGGDADGYLAKLMYSKESGRGYVFVINAYRHDIASKFESAFTHWVLKGLPEIKIPDNRFVDKKRLERYQGCYTNAVHRFIRDDSNHDRQRIDVTVRIQHSKLGPKLQWRRTEKWFDLFPQSENIFRERGESIVSVAFIQQDNDIILHGPMGMFNKVDCKTGL